MRRLAPATLELNVAGASLVAIGGAGFLAELVDRSGDDLRAAALGLGGGALVLWGLWGARAVRTAIRLALPVRPRWELESRGATVARVWMLQVLPLCVAAFAGGAAATDRLPGARSAAIGVISACGVVALLAARRVSRAQRILRRRVLREPRWAPPLGRRSLFLGPQAFSERPGGSTPAPWPAHRPPPREQTSAIELEPANPPAIHPVGVRAARGVSARRRAPRRGAGGS